MPPSQQELEFLVHLSTITLGLAALTAVVGTGAKCLEVGSRAYHKVGAQRTYRDIIDTYGSVEQFQEEVERQTSRSETHSERVRRHVGWLPVDYVNSKPQLRAVWEISSPLFYNRPSAKAD